MVGIGGRNEPEFHLEGSGALSFFAVYSPSFPERAREPNDLSLAIWLVVPKQDAKPVEDISPIRYGVVPEGYVQKEPGTGNPDPLTEGNKYYFHVDTWNAPGASGYVEIRGGKAAEVEGEHVCFGGAARGWIRVPCPKK